MPKPGFSGNARDLINLGSRLRELASVPSQAVKAASEDIADLIEKEFDAGNDAYGQPWAPLKKSTLKKGRHPPPLTDTRQLRESVEVKPMKGAGIQITLDEVPGVFHQKGTKNMVKRPILPDGPRMPEPWTQAIASAADEAVSKRMGAAK